jgi:hypothetical protein
MKRVVMRVRAQRKPSARFAIAEPAELLISTLQGCVRQQDPHGSGLRDIEKGVRKRERKVGTTFRDEKKARAPSQHDRTVFPSEVGNIFRRENLASILSLSAYNGVKRVICYA